MLDSYLMGRKARMNGLLHRGDSNDSKLTIRFRLTISSSIFDGCGARKLQKHRRIEVVAIRAVPAC